MLIKRSIISSLIILLLVTAVQCKYITNKETELKGETFIIKSTDDLEITADLYEVKGSTKPVVLLFHQAMYSRGEYRETAPKFNELGYTCIAIDQRSGRKINGVTNETHKRAKAKNFKTGYADASPDLKATIEYAIKNYENRKVILVGSSYSASLVLILENDYAENIAGVISFSPGEYFKYNNKTITEYAANIQSPVFITSAKDENEKWKTIYNAIPSTKKKSYVPDFKGQHGSKALWKQNEGSDKYWTELKRFLKSIE